jgi:hypothetical protein
MGASIQAQVSVICDGLPRVEVVYDDGISADRLTIYRIIGRRRVKVRGGVNRATSGGVVVLDHEVPFGHPVSYVAHMFDASGTSLGFTDATSVVVDVDDVFIHHPLEPSLWLKYAPLQGAFGEIYMSTVGSLFRPEGQPLPRWIGGVSGGVQGISLNGMTESFADAETLKSMFGTYDTPRVPILCVRTSPQFFMEPTLFLHIPEHTYQPVDAPTGGETVVWSMTGDEVEPPAVGLVEPVLTWDDVAARYSGWGEVAAAYPTWLDLSRDYTLTGIA